jgi:hypothetical protein
MGVPERVFRGSGWGRLAGWLCCLVCFGLAAAIGYGVAHQPDKPPHAGLALIGLAGIGGFVSLYVALTLGRLTYLVFPDALVQRRGRHVRIVPWDDIREVYQEVHASWKRYQIFTQASVIEVTSNVGNYCALGDLVGKKVAENLLPAALSDLEAGRTVPFGPLAANAGALCFDGLSCPWSQVVLATGLDMERVVGRPVRSDLVYLHVHSSARPKAYKVDLGDIPNFHLFIELARCRWPQCLPPGV